MRSCRGFVRMRWATTRISSGPRPNGVDRWAPRRSLDSHGLRRSTRRMASVGVREAKTNLSKLLRRIADGEEIEICSADRTGRPSRADRANGRPPARHRGRPRHGSGRLRRAAARRRVRLISSQRAAPPMRVPWPPISSDPDLLTRSAPGKGLTTESSCCTTDGSAACRGRGRQAQRQGRKGWVPMSAEDDGCGFRAV